MTTDYVPKIDNVRDSKVSIATSCGLDRPGFESPQGQIIFFFRTPRPTLGSTQPHIQWMQGVNRPQLEADHSPPYSDELPNRWIYTSTAPPCLHCVGRATISFRFFFLRHRPAGWCVCDDCPCRKPLVKASSATHSRDWTCRITVLRNVMSRNLTELCRRFRGTCRCKNQGVTVLWNVIW